MDFNLFNNEYIARNPNDYLYQSQPGDYIFQTQPNEFVENLKTNVQTALESISESLRNAYDSYKQNIHTYDDQYENINLNSQINLIPQIDPINNIFHNVDASQINLTPQIDLKQTTNETSIIHEELAEKESRIRQLESNQIKNTDEILQLKSEKLEDRKKIKHLDKEIKKIKENPFLKWLERATEDSKKERII